MKLLLLFIICTSLALCGCGPTLSHSQDYSLALGEILEIPIEATSRQQTLKVVASSPGKPIMVHVYLVEHAEAVNRMLTLGKPAEHLLASEENAEAVTLEAIVPADKEVVVRLQPVGPASAKVHLEVNN